MYKRQDLDIELDDLNTTEIQTNNAIEAAKKRHVDGSDYREVQDLENELATLAKRLDKIEHTRKDVVVAHKEALDRETRAQAIIAKFEEGVKADTNAARAKAADLQAQIEAATKERTALAATLPADVLTDYERLLKQFRGLAVETIQGNIPTVCHPALQASSMSCLLYTSARSVSELARSLGVDIPLTVAVEQTLYNGVTLDRALEILTDRVPSQEFYGLTD